MLGRLLAPRACSPCATASGAWRARGAARLGGFLLLALGFGGAHLRLLLPRPQLLPQRARSSDRCCTYKLLGMVFVTFFSILLFSNIVTALSTLLPVARARSPRRRADRRCASSSTRRFAETVIDSSWMMLLFALPAFLAYGVVHAHRPGLLSRSRR